MAKKPTYEELEQRIKELEKEASKRKAAQQAQQLSEQRFSLIYDSVADILFYIRVEPDDCFRFLSINHAFLKATGLTRDQIVGKRIEEVIPETSVRLVLGNYKKAIEENRIVRWEETSVYPAGEKIGEVNIAPVLNEKKICTHLIGFVHDITDLKQAEEALRENEEQYRILVETASQSGQAITMQQDRDGIEAVCVFANDAVVNLTGYTRDELSKMSWMEIVHPLYRDAAADRYRRRMQGDEITQLVPIQIIRKDGAEITIELTSLLTTFKGTKTLVTLSRNITERKQADEALRNSEARLKALSEAPFEAVFLSEKGVCLDQNQAAESLFGFTHAEAIGRHGTEWIVPEDRELVRNNMLSGYENPYEVTALRKDGTTFPCEIQARMTDSQSRSIRITALRDITDRKRAENEIRKAKEELEAKVKERTASLEETNNALKVLLERRDEDKVELQEKILCNVKELVVPYLEKIKNSGLSDVQSTYADILETNLNDIISPFLHTLSATYSGLTPREIQVANLIKQGKTNKEISESVMISIDTIAFHRKNIRRKLGLQNTKSNLRSYLMSLS